MLHKRELEELVKMEMDEEAKRAFLAMMREEQLLAILGMQAFIRSDLANVKRRQIKFEDELRVYRNKRERKEDEHGQNAIDTGTKIAQGIQAAMSQKFDRWQKLIDSILDKVITIVIIGILYLVFGGKLPTP